MTQNIATALAQKISAMMASTDASKRFPIFAIFPTPTNLE
jgi:hypothetical protein